MWWNPEGLLECPTEMMLAQPSQPSERDQGYSLGEVFFDVGNDSTHLPRGEAATIRR
jgi:hypothetical protein